MNRPIKSIAERIVEFTDFDKFILDARKDNEGRVTIPIEVNGNEKTWGGITDVNGSFFYIRWRDGFINYEEAKDDRRFAACEEFVEQIQPLRLVGVVDCAVNPYELEAEIRTALLSWKLQPTSGIKKGRVSLRQSNVDSIEVLKEELVKVKKFDKNLTFVLFDFDVSIEISATCDAKTLTL